MTPSSSARSSSSASSAPFRAAALLVGAFACWIGAVGWVDAQRKTTAPGKTAPSRAASPQPAASPAQVEAGRTRFAAQCGFCHGRDAGGGETGPDLTRSALVAEDVRGEKIGAVIRSGRLDKGMPPFALADADMAAIVAFLHDAHAKAKAENGGRRSVVPADLTSGNAEAGQRYFAGTGGCAACHQISGSFATVGSRYQGLPLLQRMLYPGSGRSAASPPVSPMVTVTTSTGQTVTGCLVSRDEFTITLTDANGWTRSWATDRVKFTIDDPLQAHVDQLAKYTDEDMHNVLAYLQTLR
jgi:cytochrome c oxidase cbb3-type subunit III